MNKNEIIGLYKLYDFELKQNNDDFLAFTYSNGYFSNVEIVLLKEDLDYSQIKNDYEILGFSVSVVKTSDINKIHDKLFTGFFSIRATKARIIKEYNDYCENQSKKLLVSKYEYIKCDYHINGEPSNQNLINNIFTKLTGSSSKLIILEAAAGFGKTCTSYEIFKCFAENAVEYIPMMTELSRNRKASVFKYVLFSEIDHNFFYLSSKLVESEIKNGRVPLIIDGFDELLSKSIEYNNENTSFEEVQSMLDTIADLLKGESKAKILITSRKSAIFTGEKFDEWVNNQHLTGKITRIELKAPQIKDWLDSEKIQALTNKGIELDYISNPILLSLLKGKNVDYINKHNVSEIIDEYFSKILTREQERQSLFLEVEEQKSILYRLAAEFAELNISSEENDFVGELIQYVIKNKIDEYISRYRRYSLDASEIVPNNDEFVMKLVHHALLDRIIPGKNEIGFINDFVFGFMLGKALEKEYLKAEALDYKYIDLICTSFMIFEEEYRKPIMKIIESVISKYNVSQQLEISDKIYRKSIIGYSNETISNVSFSKGFNFNENNSFRECIFINCTFNKCIFYDESFVDSQFYNCIFYSPDCSYISGNNTSLIFLGCIGHEEFANKVSTDVSVCKEESIDYERIVLEQFWKKGSAQPEPRRAFTTMHKGVNHNDIPKIDSAIKSLIQRGILNKLSVCYELNFSKLSNIISILGREQ